MRATVIHFEATGIITHRQEKRLVKSRRGNYHRMVDVKLDEPVMKYSMVILLEKPELEPGSLYYDGERNWSAIDNKQLVNAGQVGKTIRLPQQIIQTYAPYREQQGMSPHPSTATPQTIHLQYNP